jgi:hypothetical protein
MPKYSSFIATALRLIAQKGSAVQVARQSTSGFDPVTQANTASEALYTFQAVCLPPGKGADLVLGSLEGKNIIEATFAMSGAPIVPAPGDVLIWKGDRWKIIWTNTTDPAGDGPIVTKAYCER